MAQIVKDILHAAKRRAMALQGKDFFEKPDRDHAHERFGSVYGGWDVVESYINASSVVYSFGIGEDASFDIALIQRFGMTVHAFDPTPKSLAWVRQQNMPPQFVVHEYGLADFDGEASFAPPEDPAHVSHTILLRPQTQARAIRVPMKRLVTVMKELGHARVDLLKMDIEGAEYAVIDDLCASNIRPRQLLIEFHHRFPGIGAAKSQAAIAKLRDANYAVFAISRSGEEFSFLHESGAAN